MSISTGNTQQKSKKVKKAKISNVQSAEDGAETKAQLLAEITAQQASEASISNASTTATAMHKKSSSEGKSSSKKHKVKSNANATEAQQSTPAAVETVVRQQENPSKTSKVKGDIKHTPLPTPDAADAQQGKSSKKLKLKSDVKQSLPQQSATPAESVAAHSEPTVEEPKKKFKAPKIPSTKPATEKTTSTPAAIDAKEPRVAEKKANLAVEKLKSSADTPASPTKPILRVKSNVAVSSPRLCLSLADATLCSYRAF